MNTPKFQLPEPAIYNAGSNLTTQLKRLPVRINVKRQSWFVLVFLLLLNISLFAQTKTVEGTVVDSKGSPVVGANITVKGTTNTVTTDNRGHYSINVEPGAVLVFSFTSMHPRNEIVGAGSTVDVTLQENPMSLETIVVVGYGTQKKVNLSGSVSQVSGKELINRPVPNGTS